MAAHRATGPGQGGVCGRATGALPAGGTGRTATSHDGGSRSTPERIRTAATALRGRRPRPLDDGGWREIWNADHNDLAGVPGLEPRLAEPESAGLPITPYPNEPPRAADHGPAYRSVVVTVPVAVTGAMCMPMAGLARARSRTRPGRRGRR